ncbi:MAG: bifunctional phosphoserine phosphatase/homoserine phosphotransferase ThrH [Acidimicrobiales bacterium]
MNENAPAPRLQQSIITLDVEGVLVPEIWVAVAERTGIEFLTRTTRDEPDYDVLMTRRLECLAENGIGLSTIQEVIGTLSPLDGADDFLRNLRSTTQVVLLSDTFEEFARPLMAQLGWPTVLCHRLHISDDTITGYQLRMPDQKRKAVAAFQSLNYQVAAAGDSYNDTTMLGQANAGFLFNAPDNVIAEFPQFPACTDYDVLTEHLFTSLGLA